MIIQRKKKEKFFYIKGSLKSLTFETVSITSLCSSITSFLLNLYLYAKIRLIVEKENFKKTISTVNKLDLN